MSATYTHQSISLLTYLLPRQSLPILLIILPHPDHRIPLEFTQLQSPLSRNFPIHTPILIFSLRGEILDDLAGVGSALLLAPARISFLVLDEPSIAIVGFRSSAFRHGGGDGTVSLQLFLLLVSFPVKWFLARGEGFGKLSGEGFR